MSQSYTNLLYHIIFSTKEREPLINDIYERPLYDYIGGTIRGMKGTLLEINCVTDHVHLLTKLPPYKALSDFIRTLKAGASGWMHIVFPELQDFSWQRRYGAYTVSHSNVENVRVYIARQKEHHFTTSSHNEFIQFLRANDVEYDDRYL